jgi:hypothetical protein
MQQDWNQGHEAYPFDGSHVERVVPADGDPEAEAYRARLRQREQFAANRFRWSQSVGRRRSGLRRLLWIGAAIVLLILFIRPLAVLATIGLVLLFSLAAVIFLAASAIFLAARFVLGGRYPYLGTRGPWPRPHGHD